MVVPRWNDQRSVPLFEVPVCVCECVLIHHNLNPNLSVPLSEWVNEKGQTSAAVECSVCVCCWWWCCFCTEHCHTAQLHSSFQQFSSWAKAAVAAFFKDQMVFLVVVVLVDVRVVVFWSSLLRVLIGSLSLSLSLFLPTPVSLSAFAVSASRRCLLSWSVLCCVLLLPLSSTCVITPVEEKIGRKCARPQRALWLVWVTLYKTATTT